MNKFKVITGNNNETELAEITRLITLHDAWNRQYSNTISDILGKHDIEKCSQHELMKVALCGVKYINCAIDVDRENHRLNDKYELTFEIKESAFTFIDALFGVIGRIKLNNLIKIFPIEKTYDGDKWECKDYFYTMNVLKKKGLDSAVGRDDVFGLLWDYENNDLSKITLFYMECMSALYRQQTGVSMTDKFFDDIPSYYMDKESEILVSDDGEILKTIPKMHIMK